ncbi:MULTISPECIES: metal ABC transporter permease [unclassified Granulicatella]|uniref:metal ABC transporter permease n=1 Tax=unclassified Granulicatella TaxID=2630493 RepID=UPI0010737CCB|nr:MULTISPECIES: metal ABC transporter permease [unclassified Granulicatella]MBF0779813.1 metal ABC transporter permease [Granulicatella sp. 19428wC4_WM01]TFU96114.1 metal ABC transporter permease [Granulicatella sp. WM01]
MFELILILSFLAMACSSIGSILVIKNQSMIADALAHSVLLGIVLGFFISNSLDSPLLIIGATIFGVITVSLINTLLKSPKINHDTATGMIFPLLFSIAVILISMFARNVHLDIDMVLMGEIIFATLNRVQFLGLDVPYSLVKVVIMCLINVGFIYFMYQRLRIFLFDATHAKLVGIPIKFLQLCLTTLVSLTSVIAFDTVGSITVISLFISPSLISLAWSKSYKQLILYGFGVSILTSATSVMLATLFDVTISGMYSFTALIFLIISIILKKVHTLALSTKQHISE